jgi:hypothetical protein
MEFGESAYVRDMPDGWAFGILDQICSIFL